MKRPVGAEKKRVKRSSGSASTAARDSGSDAPPRKKGVKKDLFQLFAEKVRDHKGLESRWAVMEQARVEYFRGKDFVNFIKNHPECKEVLEEDKDLDTEDIANVLLEKNLLVRCDRVTKTLRPGKKKLSTWPAHLEIFREDQAFSETDAFFAWTFEKRHPLWQTLLSFFWPVLTLAICLFPVYPHRCKLIVLYSCAGILLMILSLLFVRAVAFGAMWILLGKRVWFFPNILAEEATLKELRHAPDEAARARYQRRMSNIIDDVLEWSPKLALSGLMENQPPVNITEAANNSSDAASPDYTEEADLDETQGEEEAEDWTNSNIKT
ncbi:BnaA01g25490D [Brassica napus]|uniref:Translocation protein SEC62 n=1 Tax=Brassica napus TaxID=3708 RepID=A0A078HJ16_BRANA|nr:BnaA01g25490D [Brassica napus]